MDFEFSEKSQRIQAQIKAFIAEHVTPRDAETQKSSKKKAFSRRPSSRI